MENRRTFIKKIGYATGAMSFMGITNVLGWDRKKTWSKPTRLRGRITDGQKGLARICVSDGENVALTDHSGHFDFWSSGNQPFVFVSQPPGYRISQQANGSAAFYKPIDTSKATNDYLFRLTPLTDSDKKHNLLLLADPQIQNEYEVNQLLRVSAPDLIQTIKELNTPNTFAVGCGDLVFDRLDLFAAYDRAIKQTNIPFFQVIGNHDMDPDTRSDKTSSATFESLYGPTYYSFNRGEVHYVVLDDVFFTGANKEYIGYITEEQLAWLEKDLQHVVVGTTVVVCTHIPVFSGVHNKEHLYEILAPYNVHILSGHTHRNDNDLSPNRFEHCHGTVCGAWWSGPICSDGTPNGYGVYQMNGSDVSWYYKAVGMPKTHQFRFYKRGDHQKFPNSCCLNVWNWDPNWKICWYENGERKSHIRRIKATDPLSVKLHLGKELPERRPWVEPTPNGHMFFFEPDRNAQSITVEVTDSSGNVYTETVRPNGA